MAGAGIGKFSFVQEYALQDLGISNTGFKAHSSRMRGIGLFWLAVQKLKLSYDDSKTILFTICP